MNGKPAQDAQRLGSVQGRTWGPGRERVEREAEATGLPWALNVSTMMLVTRDW